MIVIFILAVLILFFVITGAYSIALAIFLLLIVFGLLGSFGSYLHSRKWNKLTPEQQRMELDKVFQEHQNLQKQTKDIQKYSNVATIYDATYYN